MKKIYLSGKITGKENYQQDFARAKALLCPFYEVLNPCDFVFSDATNYFEIMRFDVARMLECDGVALLDDWQQSRGACIEKDIAEMLQMTVLSVADWLKKAESELIGAKNGK